MRNNYSEDDLTALISAAVKRKKKQHAGKCGIHCEDHLHPYIHLHLITHSLYVQVLVRYILIDCLFVVGMLNLSQMENRPMILIGG